MDSSHFYREAAGVLGGLEEAAGRWRERWIAAGGSGYSDSEEALLETDDLLRTVEASAGRWRELQPPDELAGRHADVTEKLADLRTRLDEVLTALEHMDVERLRVAAQAAELSVQHLSELRGALVSAG